MAYPFKTMGAQRSVGGERHRGGREGGHRGFMLLILEGRGGEELFGKAGRWAAKSRDSELVSRKVTNTDTDP